MRISLANYIAKQSTSDKDKEITVTDYQSHPARRRASRAIALASRTLFASTGADKRGGQRTMIQRNTLLLATSMFGFLTLAACNKPAEVHYRVTVDVNDRGTIRSGSSVWAFALSKSALPLASAYNYRFRGEAVAVDLPGRGTLFALLNGKLYPENLFGDFRRPRSGPPRFSDRVEDLRHIATMVGESAELDCVNPPWPGVSCPELVRFRDASDPTTIEKVDPGSLVGSFGTDVRLSRIAVQITDDPVTETRIAQRLPYGKSDSGFSEWYRSLPFGDPRRVTSSDFYQGFQK
ncbi:MAG: hypothetical protein AB7G25_04770 [Sphingomonadaceae bacterium]